MIEINKYIDHTLLRATATEEEVANLCREAAEYEFFSVCVNSSFVSFAKEQLKGTEVKVCAVVGFPLGAMSTPAKENVLKVILETCYLTPEEILLGSELSVKAGADFVKTSTGFGTAGADKESIELMKKATEGKAKIKASGGIKNLDTALYYIELGVERIGTSSGISIVKELRA